MVYALLAFLALTCQVEGSAYVRSGKSEVNISPLGTAEAKKPTPRHQDHLGRLWDGQDLPDDVQRDLLANSNFVSADTEVRTVKDVPVGEHRWGLHGAFDTGTNLFLSSVHINFPSATHETGIWKHSTSGASNLTKAWEDQMAPMPLDQLVLVIMVRSPISQIASWKKMAYNMFGCVKAQHYTDMNQPCIATTDNINGTDQDHFGEMSFNSVMDAYNTYLTEWKALHKEKRFKDVMIVSYEDLVLSPEEVMKKFGNVMGLSGPTGGIQVFEESAKQVSQKSNGRAEALQKLKERAWLQSVGTDGLAALCPELDTGLISDLVEGTYLPQSQRVPYSVDCQAYVGTPKNAS